MFLLFLSAFNLFLCVLSTFLHSTSRLTLTLRISSHLGSPCPLASYPARLIGAVDSSRPQHSSETRRDPLLSDFYSPRLLQLVGPNFQQPSASCWVSLFDTVIAHSGHRSTCWRWRCRNSIAHDSRRPARTSRRTDDIASLYVLKQLLNVSELQLVVYTIV